MKRDDTDSDDGLGPLIDVLFVLLLSLLLFVRHETQRLAVVQGERSLDGQIEYDQVKGIEVEMKPDGLTVEGKAVSEEEFVAVIQDLLNSSDKEFVNYAVGSECLSGRSLSLREKLCEAIGRSRVYEIFNIESKESSSEQ